MELQQSYLLPGCFNSSLFCWTLHYSDTLATLPDITVCHMNGYVYEIKDKAVVASLYLKNERPLSIEVYYFYENNFFLRYYLVHTFSNKLFLIKRNETGFYILKFYDNIEHFLVFDFKSIGHPQIKIFFIESGGFEIVEFSNLDNVVIGKEENEELHNGHNIDLHLSKLLWDRLQVVDTHVYELKEEINQIKHNFLKTGNELCSHMSLPPSNSICLFSKSKRKITDEVNVINKWYQIFETFWIFGVRVSLKNKTNFDKLDFLIHGECFNQYNISLFTIPVATPFSASCSEQELLIIGAAQIRFPILYGKLSISLFLKCSNLGNALLLETIHLSAYKIWDMLQNKGIGDCLALMSTKMETVVSVKTEISEDDMTQLIFLEKLKFSKVEVNSIFPVDFHYFYCPSIEIGVASKVISCSPSIWEFRLYTNYDRQIYIFVNALYDLLPEKTTILGSFKSKEV